MTKPTETQKPWHGVGVIRFQSQQEKPKKAGPDRDSYGITRIWKPPKFPPIYLVNIKMTANTKSKINNWNSYEIC